jgi:hypothetical protein
LNVDPGGSVVGNLLGVGDQLEIEDSKLKLRIQRRKAIVLGTASSLFLRQRDHDAKRDGSTMGHKTKSYADR